MSYGYSEDYLRAKKLYDDGEYEEALDYLYEISNDLDYDCRILYGECQEKFYELKEKSKREKEEEKRAEKEEKEYWKNNGKHVVEYSNGYYDGDLSDGEEHGDGVFVWNDCSKNGWIRYEGEWRCGYMEGCGTAYLKDGGSYYGYFKKSMFDGRGWLKLGNGDYFAGTFEKGLFDGVGVYYYADGSYDYGLWRKGNLLVPQNMPIKKVHYTYLGIYDGEAYDDECFKQGTGTMKYNNGDVYIGEWSKNLRCGKGVMTYADGTVVEGEWLYDKLIKVYRKYSKGR